MVGAVGAEDGVASGGGAGDGGGVDGGVGAVFGEPGPVGPGGDVDEEFGEFDDFGAGSVEAVAGVQLCGGGAVDGGVGVAQEDGSVGAEEVDVLVAVDVPDVSAVAALEELGEVVGQWCGVLVSVHAVGDDVGGALSEVLVGVAGRSVLVSVVVMGLSWVSDWRGALYRRA